MSNIYQGAQHQLTATPAPTFDGGGVTQRNQQGAKRAFQNFSGLGEQVVRFVDFSTQQEDEARLHQAARDFDVEVENRLMLPDGHSDSFFEPNGSLRQHKLNALTQKYQKDFSGIGQQIIDPEARLQMQSRAQHAIDGMSASLISRGAKEAQRKAMVNYQNNQALALERGDYATALSSNEAAVRAGLIPQSEADLKNHQIGQQSLMQSAQSLYQSDPLQFIAAMDRGEYNGADVGNMGQLQSLYNRSMGAFQRPPRTREVKDASGKTIRTEEVKEAPWGLPSNMVKLYNQYGGSFDASTQQHEVRPALRQYVEYIAHTNPQAFDTPETQQHIEEISKAFGNDASYAKDLIKSVQSQMTSPAAYDPWGAMEQVDFSETFSEKSQKDLRSWRKELRDLTHKKYHDDDELTDEEKKRMDQLEETLKEWEGFTKDARSRLTAQTKESYALWRNTPEGKKASYNEQVDQFWNIFDTYAQNVDASQWDIVKEEKARAHQYNSELKEQRARQEDEYTNYQTDITQTDVVRSNHKAQELGIIQPPQAEEAPPRYDPLEAARASAPATRPSPSSHTLGRDYAAVSRREDYVREPILYVPKGQPYLSTMLLRNGDVEAYARVVETDEVSSPTMSAVLRGQLGDVQGTAGQLNIRDGVGELSARARGNYATGGFAGQLNVSRIPAPLRPYAKDYIECGEKYGVNPALLVAISMHETANGTSNAFRNKRNAMGISNAKGVVAQSSVRASIERMARLMGTARMYKGKDLPAIARVYAPVGAGNDPRGYNQYWTRGVSKYINQITS